MNGIQAEIFGLLTRGETYNRDVYQILEEMNTNLVLEVFNYICANAQELRPLQIHVAYENFVHIQCHSHSKFLRDVASDSLDSLETYRRKLHHPIVWNMLGYRYSKTEDFTPESLPEVFRELKDMTRRMRGTIAHRFFNDKGLDILRFSPECLMVMDTLDQAYRMYYICIARKFPTQFIWPPKIASFIDELVRQLGDDRKTIGDVINEIRDYELIKTTERPVFHSGWHDYHYPQIQLDASWVSHCLTDTVKAEIFGLLTQDEIYIGERLEKMDINVVLDVFDRFCVNAYNLTPLQINLTYANFWEIKWRSKSLRDIASDSLDMLEPYQRRLYGPIVWNILMCNCAEYFTPESLHEAFRQLPNMPRFTRAQLVRHFFHAYEFRGLHISIFSREDLTLLEILDQTYRRDHTRWDEKFPTRWPWPEDTASFIDESAQQLRNGHKIGAVINEIFGYEFIKTTERPALDVEPIKGPVCNPPDVVSKSFVQLAKPATVSAGIALFEPAEGPVCNPPDAVSKLFVQLAGPATVSAGIALFDTVGPACNPPDEPTPSKLEKLFL